MDSTSHFRARIASALALVTAFTSSGAALAADTVALAGRVVSVDGKVLIRTDEGMKGATELKPGAVVKEGDVINTASNGKVKLLLEDKTILDLGPSALFKVEQFKVNNGGDRQVALSMPYGTVRTSVSRAIAKGGKFQIRTRTATMGVRGTIFVVQSEMDTSASGTKGADGAKGDGGGRKDGGKSSEASSTKITVVQGKVEVSNHGSDKISGDSRKLASSGKTLPAVMLTAGTQLITSSSQSLSRPVTLSKTDLASVSNSTKLVDNTFQKAVNLNFSSDSGGGNSGGSGSGGESAAGQATRAAIVVALSSPSSLAPTSIVASVPATIIQQTVYIPPGGFSHIHIVVK